METIKTDFSSIFRRLQHLEFTSKLDTRMAHSFTERNELNCISVQISLLRHGV